MIDSKIKILQKLKDSHPFTPETIYDIRLYGGPLEFARNCYFIYHGEVVEVQMNDVVTKEGECMSINNNHYLLDDIEYE